MSETGDLGVGSCGHGAGRGGAELAQAVAYQSPGGVWGAVEEVSGPQPWCVDGVGMALEERQLTAVMDTAESAERSRCIASVVCDGLLYFGRCPRCHHWMQTRE